MLTNSVTENKSSKNIALRLIACNGANDKKQKKIEVNRKIGKILPRDRKNTSISKTVMKRRLKVYNEEKPIIKQLNYVGIEWYDGEHDSRDITTYLYIDGILYDCDHDDMIELDKQKKSFAINGTGSYYVEKRKAGYELFPVDGDNQMDIDDFKRELKSPSVVSHIGRPIQPIESIGYAVVQTKKDWMNTI